MISGGIKCTALMHRPDAPPLKIVVDDDGSHYTTPMVTSFFY
jgi:hypothetical protein